LAAASAAQLSSGEPDDGRVFTGELELIIQDAVHCLHSSSLLLTFTVIRTLKPIHACAESFVRVVFPTALALMLCNMDRIVMSVAILPMATEFGWAPGVQVGDLRRYTDHVLTL
jgi:hypothetical protein